MRTYYLFWIKSEFYSAYFKKNDSLYKTIENLYREKDIHPSLKISLYGQICELHKVDILSSYLDAISYRKKNKKYLLTLSKTKEKTIIIVRPSVIIIKTNKNIPHIFKALSYYSPYLFVCDFNNQDYFWLSNHYYKKHAK